MKKLLGIMVLGYRISWDILVGILVGFEMKQEMGQCE